MTILQEAEKWVEKECGVTGVAKAYDATGKEICTCKEHNRCKYERCSCCCQPEVEKEVSIAPDATVTLHDHEFKHVCCQLEVGKKELCPKGCFQCDSPKGVITSWSFPCEKGGHCHHNSCDVRHEKPCDEPNCVQSKYRHRKDLSDLELREMKLQPQPSKCEHEWDLTCLQFFRRNPYSICKKCKEVSTIPFKPSSELPEIEGLDLWDSIDRPGTVYGKIQIKINELVRAYNVLKERNRT